MKPTPEIEARGSKAYEQARAFEALQRRGLPWIYAFFVLIVAVFGVLLMEENHHDWAIRLFLLAAAFAGWSWWHWNQQAALYDKNEKLLVELKSEYGDSLPWLQMEKHFAELEKLQSDLAEEKRRTEEHRG